MAFWSSKKKVAAMATTIIPNEDDTKSRLQIAEDRIATLEKKINSLQSQLNHSVNTTLPRSDSSQKQLYSDFFGEISIRELLAHISNHLGITMGRDVPASRGEIKFAAKKRT
jgi:hypothetical protein